MTGIQNTFMTKAGKRGVLEFGFMSELRSHVKNYAHVGAGKRFRGA